MVGFEKALGAVKVVKDQIQYRSQSLLSLARGYFSCCELRVVESFCESLRVVESFCELLRVTFSLLLLPTNYSIFW